MVPISEEGISYEILPAPHQHPKRLPPGRSAVYVFCNHWHCLRVGKVGPENKARFTRDHYSPRSSRNNLPKSLLTYRDRLEAKVNFAAASELADGAWWDENTIGEWIAYNTSRIHFFLDESQPRAVVSLLEAFLQCRLSPMFENG